MAYTPINWATGDTITADKLNRCDNGWGVESTQLFSETVTTVAGQHGNVGQLAYQSQIDSPSLTVTFDGAEYECTRIDNNGSYIYGGFSTGGPDFTNYPFFIFSGDNINQLVTQTAGEHVVTALVSTLQTSSDFDAAVSMASPIDASTLPLRCVEGVTTYEEATNALNNGRLVYFTANDETYSATPKCFMVNAVSRTCTIVPTSTKIAAKFGTDDNLFYIEHLSS